MVRVPGSLGDSGFHRESDKEEVQVKIEQGEQASLEIGSTTTPLNEARSADRQSAGRSTVDRQDIDPDLEEKPRFPPQVPSGTPADLDANRDLQKNTEDQVSLEPYVFSAFAAPAVREEKVKREPYTFVPSGIPAFAIAKTERPAFTGVAASEVPKQMPKKKKGKTAKKKLKAPESDTEDRSGRKLNWSKNMMAIEKVYHEKVLRDFLSQNPVMRSLQITRIGDPSGPVKIPYPSTNPLEAEQSLMDFLDQAGLIAEAFDPDQLFDMDRTAIQTSTHTLFQIVKSLVGEAPRITSRQPSTVTDSSGAQTGPHITSRLRRNQIQKARRSRSECH